MSSNNNDLFDESQSRTVFIASKYRGETLSRFIDRIRAEHAIAAEVPMTYAGRLDPMAEGVMLVLTGEACKEKDTYLGFDKTYEFEMLIGITTDTYDVLGLVQDVTLPIQVVDEQVIGVLQELQSKTVWEYPMYSSRTVEGKPLFAYARAGITLDEVPSKEGSIKDITLNTIRTVQFYDLIENIIADIRLVQGDFRQEQIVDGWKEIQEEYGAQPVQLVSCTATVTSGVYIRSIAYEVGQKLGCGAIAYSINRTQIHITSFLTV